MSDDITLVLDQNTLNVKLTGMSLHISSPDHPSQRIPLGLLGQLIVHGNPAINCDVWRALAERNIPAILLPSRGTGSAAWLGSGLSTAVQVRIKQYNAYQSNIGLQIAIWLLHCKLQSQINLLTILQQSSPITDPLFSKQETNLQSIQQSITIWNQQLNKAYKLNELLGYEGTASASWYGLLTNCLPSKWHFSGRNKRPPKDPVNSLLSLSYTLVLSEVRRAVQQRGLDPCLGFLHQVLAGRESLVLDIMEPFRAGADLFVLELINSELLPEHFTMSSRDGCRLSKEGRNLYYSAWAVWRLNWPWQLISLPDSKLSVVDGHDQSRTLADSCRWFTNQFTTQWLNSTKGNQNG